MASQGQTLVSYDCKEFYRIGAWSWFGGMGEDPDAPIHTTIKNNLANIFCHQKVLSPDFKFMKLFTSVIYKFSI
jgi:hypothetical protein